MSRLLQLTMIEAVFFTTLFSDLYGQNVISQRNSPNIRSRAFLLYVYICHSYPSDRSTQPLFVVDSWLRFE